MTFIKSEKVLSSNFDGCVVSQFQRVHDDLNLYKRPETYQTLLKDEYGVNSRTTSIQRKLKSLKKNRLIYDDPIPSRNGRLKLFYIFEKEYFIVITKTDVFYCDEIDHKDKVLNLTKCYKLNNKEWVLLNNHSIKSSEVLKCF